MVARLGRGLGRSLSMKASRYIWLLTAMAAVYVGGAGSQVHRRQRARSPCVSAGGCNFVMGLCLHIHWSCRDQPVSSRSGVLCWTQGVGGEPHLDWTPRWCGRMAQIQISPPCVAARNFARFGPKRSIFLLQRSQM